MTSFHDPCRDELSGERGELLPVAFGTGARGQLKNARSQHEVTQICDSSFTARLMVEGGGFVPTCENLGRIFDRSFPACAF